MAGGDYDEGDEDDSSDALSTEHAKYWQQANDEAWVYY
jgi:hypothetical protein